MTPALRAALRSLGVTQDAFAAITGLTPGTVSDWGRTPPREREAGKVRSEPGWPWLLVRWWEKHPDDLAEVIAVLAEFHEAHPAPGRTNGGDDE